MKGNLDDSPGVNPVPAFLRLSLRPHERTCPLRNRYAPSELLQWKNETRLAEGVNDQRTREQQRLERESPG